MGRWGGGIEMRRVGAPSLAGVRDELDENRTLGMPVDTRREEPDSTIAPVAARNRPR